MNKNKNRVFIDSKTQLIAMSNIISGLLASGHYTDKDAHHDDTIIKIDYDLNWEEIYQDSPEVLRRHMPQVIIDAYDLYHMASEVTLKDHHDSLA